MGIAYTPTAWVNGIAPAINATNLLNIENQLVSLSAAASTFPVMFTGQLIESEITIPTSTTSPVYPRWDDNHDILNSGAGGSATLVTAFRAQKAGLSAGGTYTTDFTGVTSANNAGDTDLTFPNTVLGIAAVTAITNQGLVNGWFSSNQSATFTADFATAASKLTLNYNGTDYVVKATTVASRIVKLSGVNLGVLNATAIIYPYRVMTNDTTPDATKVRLRRLTGFVPVSAGDYDGLIANGLQVMDTGQGHWHQTYSNTITGAQSSFGYVNNGLAAGTALSLNLVREAVPDGTNGTPRTGKNFSPRTAGIFLYTYAGTVT
jgi:hypothetical protein